MNLAIALATAVTPLTELLIGVTLIGGILGVAFLARFMNSRKETRAAQAPEPSGNRESRRSAAA